MCLCKVECDDPSDFVVSTFWNCGCDVYIYISVPNYFSVNAEGAHCNVVFILSRSVLSVTFMVCDTVCIKILFVCYCTAVSQVPILSFA